MVVTPQAEAFNNWMQKVQDARQAIEQASLTWVFYSFSSRSVAAFPAFGGPNKSKFLSVLSDGWGDAG